jgi:hypothetical protein
MVSRYKSFVESIELMMLQLKQVITRFFSTGPTQVSVQGSWSPGTGLAQTATRLHGGAGGDSHPIVVGYLVFSHAAMLATVLWLLVRSWHP